MSRVQNLRTTESIGIWSWFPGVGLQPPTQPRLRSALLPRSPLSPPHPIQTKTTYFQYLGASPPYRSGARAEAAKGSTLNNHLQVFLLIWVMGHMRRGCLGGFCHPEQSDGADESTALMPASLMPVPSYLSSKRRRSNSPEDLRANMAMIPIVVDLTQADRTGTDADSDDELPLASLIAYMTCPKWQSAGNPKDPREVRRTLNMIFGASGIGTCI
jgi:hypothetical protein